MSSVGNARPQSTTTMVSSYSKAVIFIPICSRPPNGIMRTFGLELVSASTFFALGVLAGFSFLAERSALSARSAFAGFSAFSPRTARSVRAGFSVFSALAAVLRVPLGVFGFLSSCVFSFSEDSAPSARFGAAVLGLLGPLLRLFRAGRSLFSSFAPSFTGAPPASFPVPAVFRSFSAFCCASCFASTAGAATFCSATFFLETNSASSASTDFASC